MRDEELKDIIAAYGERLSRYAVTILASFHDAEDIVQEVFIAAYEKRESFDGDNLGAWLYRITYNRCINHAKRRKFALFAEPPEPAARRDAGFGFNENTLNALRRLKPMERALIHGRVMDERSYEDLAREFNASPTALRKRYERAKKKLAGYIAESREELEYE